MMAADVASADQFILPPAMSTLIDGTQWKPHLQTAPNCPRCASSNTKFCYYNNYSLSQPRYFCKSCRRYWTKGGSLRNVPVGGGCRRTRRSKSSRSSRASAANVPPPHPSSDAHNTSSSGGDSSTSSSDIDMAVVFAKFLNPAAASNGVTNSNSVSSTPESGQMISDDHEGIVFPSAGNLADPYEFTDLFREEGFLEADQNQESMIDALGLQTLLSDEMAQLEAALWSTSTAMDPGSAAAVWEPQEQSGFNASGDMNNWGCYDLQLQGGSFDIFPGH